MTHIWKSGPCFQNAFTPLSPLVFMAGSLWSSLPFGKCCGLGSVGYMVYRQGQALFRVMGRLLTPVRATHAWHLGERARRKRPCQRAGTRLNSRPRFLRHTSAVGLYIAIDENRNGFPLYLLLLDLTYHRKSKERVEN